jgi:hypothetical protein
VFTFGSRFWVRRSTFGVHGSGFGVHGSRFGVRGSGFAVRGSGFAVRGGIPLAVARNPSQFRQDATTAASLDGCADMDVREAVDLIAALVAHQVSLVSTFFIDYGGYPKDWAEFRAEAHV